MRLSHVSEACVWDVVEKMRDRDKQEIYGLRHSEDPALIVRDVLAMANFSWVAWLDDMPQVVFGGGEVRPGVWSMYAFATDEFPRLALGLTRFVKKTIIPTLFNDLGAHRLQCDSHVAHTDAHKWLNMLGGEVESWKKGFGKDGSTYLEFVILKAIDKPDKIA